MESEYGIDVKNEAEIFSRIGWFDTREKATKYFLGKLFMRRYLIKTKRFDSAMLELGSEEDAVKVQEENDNTCENDEASLDTSGSLTKDETYLIPLWIFVSREIKKSLRNITKELLKTDSHSDSRSIVGDAPVYIAYHKVLEKLHTYSDWRDYTVQCLSQLDEKYNLKNKRNSEDFLFYLKEQKRERERDTNYENLFYVPLIILVIELCQSFFVGLNYVGEEYENTNAGTVMNNMFPIAIMTLIAFLLFGAYQEYQKKQDKQREWIEEYINIVKSYLAENDK